MFDCYLDERPERDPEYHQRVAFLRAMTNSHARIAPLC